MQAIFTSAKSTVAAAILAATALYPVVAQGQPSGANLPKMIKIVVPFAPGASTDIFARLLGQKLGVRIGGTVVVENRTGATGSIGAEYVSRAVADGSTLLLTATPFSANAAVQPKLPYDPINGFAPVAMVASGPQILVVSSDSPYKSTAQLLDAARANKGKLNYGSTGIGSSHHLNTARFNMMAGTEMTHVPYKGGGLAVTDLIGGRIQVMLFSYSTVMPHVKGGKLRALAVSSLTRSKFTPDLPTLSETVHGFTDESWWGTFVPAGTPQPVVNRLNSEIRAIVLSPEMRNAFEKEGVDSGSMTVGEFTSFVRSDIDKWRNVARKLNIVAE
ncbi:MAG: tripartite tricarboxylate transporter substrate binding protein [Betaproteobacteria bacterium]|nr:tripartite tricarboxylate transporter substrate binding protein [Betaproteobacteria bacterium]